MKVGVALTNSEVRDTVDSIACVQLADGAIPWFASGHVDPWNHVEAAMALDAGGRHHEAHNAYRWMARTQRRDGAWAAAYGRGTVEDATLDANFSAYVAVGAWHHYVATGDVAFLSEMWPVVTRALDFALDLQMPGGFILWARDAMYRPWPGALLTSSSCIHLSLRCGITIAQQIGDERPDWELSLAALAQSIASRESCFESKRRFSMDWYYPVLAGVLTGERARERLSERWNDFVVEGRGIRCVADRPWVTTGETCELVLALIAIGDLDAAARLFEWVQHLRVDTGAYWTGATFPDGVPWPREQTSWSAAAIVLAADALGGGCASAVFEGEGLVELPPLSDPVADPL